MTNPPDRPEELVNLQPAKAFLPPEMKIRAEKITSKENLLLSAYPKNLSVVQKKHPQKNDTVNHLQKTAVLKPGTTAMLLLTAKKRRTQNLSVKAVRKAGHLRKRVFLPDHLPVQAAANLSEAGTRVILVKAGRKDLLKAAILKAGHTKKISAEKKNATLRMAKMQALPIKNRLCVRATNL